jgi:hypothetical protein
MMREVLSGTCESGRVKFVKTNTKTDWFKVLRKKIKKRFGRLKKNTTFVKETR